MVHVNLFDASFAIYAKYQVAYLSCRYLCRQMTHTHGALYIALEWEIQMRTLALCIEADALEDTP